VDLGPFLPFIILYGILSLLGRAAKKRQQAGTDPDQPVPRERVPGKPETLEDLLAEMRGQLDQAATVEQAPARPRIGRPADHELPGAEEVEERASLEIEREAVSLEVAAPQVGREIIDLDDQGEAIVARRIHEAELRNRAWQASDHRAFDARIRRVKAVPSAAAPAAARLREMMIWREVLGPPVALRDE
jgi:hypothetical protein